MPDKPAAELGIDADLIRRLLPQASGLIPDAASLPVQRVAAGWDADIWRLGDLLAVRLPRRALAAPLIHNEARALPLIGPRIEATGIRVPVPVFVGDPTPEYPWSWSVVPWIAGMPGLDVPRAERARWAEPLARALLALHAPAPSDHPVNPVRGVPLADRAESVAIRFRTTAAHDIEAAQGVWERGLAAAPWAGPPVWIHGDLHPGNLIVSGGMLQGIIDFGDVTAGDPAYDLAVAWLAFDAPSRAVFVAATRERYDRATWVRAQAWAAAVAVMLLSQSDDDPAYGALGRESLREVSSAAF